MDNETTKKIIFCLNRNMLYYYYLSKEEKRAKKTCYKRIEKLMDKNKCEMLEECY